MDLWQGRADIRAGGLIWRKARLPLVLADDLRHARTSPCGGDWSMTSDFDVFVTADEAWPAFERAVLNAERSVRAGFRIFDMRTALRSPEARAMGKTWFDLLAHKLGQGLRFSLVVSDFDPVMAPGLHAMALRTLRQGAALAETAEAGPDQLRVHAHMHPARVGHLPWLAFLPTVVARRKKTLRRMNRARVKREAFGLASVVLPPLHPATHHQKLAVIDDTLLYIGGLDLNERRYDTPEHDRPAKDTWSDCQVLIRGPQAKAASAHLDTFEAACAGQIAPPPCPGLKRTLSTPRRLQLPFVSPQTRLSEIEAAHVTAFQKAQHLIYIETQFLRSSVVAGALAEAGARKAGLSVIVILPNLPEELAFEGATGLDIRFGLARRRDAIATVVEAFGPRACFASPVQPYLDARETAATLAGSPVIHVHNKVLITDAAYGLIGSANLNGRSMRWDTEVALELTTPAHLACARARLLQHWWHEPLPETATDPAQMYPWWSREITRNGLVLPENRRGFLVPFDARKDANLAQPLPGVTEDIV